MAESLTMTAAGLMDADTGIYAHMGTGERLERRLALVGEAQVHATLALAAATALNRSGVRFTDAATDAWLDVTS
jgi:hypothetical protein